jgi:dTDP-4-dehydrorhamnose reductase
VKGDSKFNMKIIVTGSNGQLGKEITRQFSSKHELILTDSHSMNITNQQQVRDTFAMVKPQAVIHCAAYTNVDSAEYDFDSAYKVNVVGSQNLAAACLEQQARMVYISTDYVFDGVGAKPYREYDVPNPINVYGKTKLLGEQIVSSILGRHYILRTAWLYGNGNNFVKTMLKLAKEKDKLQVVNDQIGSPTYTKDLVVAIFRLLSTESYGTYHTTCNGSCSWYDFACKIFELSGVMVPIEPVQTEFFPRPANRPKHSVLENYMLAMTIGDSMRTWEESLSDYIRQI